MLKKYLSLALAATLSLLLAPSHARAQSAADAERIKAEVTKIGAGARVRVKLRDRGRLTGYVGEIGDQGFVVTKAKEGTKQQVAYADVAEVKIKNEKRVSTAGKVLIGLGALWLVGMIATGGGGG